MSIDFSIFKNIDFTNTENLLFLFIFLILLLIVFLIVILILNKVRKILKRLLARIFNIDAKKPQFSKGENTDWLHQPKDAEGNKEASFMPRQKVIGGDYIGGSSSESKKEPEKNYKQKYEEKEQKDIAGGLSKLKSDGSAGGDTLESKMPSRSAQQEDDSHKEIKIPRRKRFDKDIITSSSLHGQALVYEKDKVEAAKKTVQEQKRAPIEKALAGKEVGISSMADVLEPPVIKEEASNQQVKQDNSIFNGGSEISRTDLRQKLRKDPKVWQAERQEGMTLSPSERAKLVKEVFSPTLGRNISRTDLKLSVKKLNQKMLGTKDSAEHAKIRKEIKFFKKIGGIK